MFPSKVGCSAAMVLPVATPANAMVYATGRCHAADLRKAGLVVPVVGIAWLWLVLPWVLRIAG